jgi:hypothetical protein
MGYNKFQSFYQLFWLPFDNKELSFPRCQLYLHTFALVSNSFSEDRFVVVLVTTTESFEHSLISIKSRFFKLLLPFNLCRLKTHLQFGEKNTFLNSWKIKVMLIAAITTFLTTSFFFLTFELSECQIFKFYSKLLFLKEFFRRIELEQYRQPFSQILMVVVKVIMNINKFRLINLIWREFEWNVGELEQVRQR